MMTTAQILIVEDDSIIAQSIHHHLNNLGYGVPGMAVSGVEAIRLAGEWRPDLILMDIKLAGEMDGVTTAEQIRARYQIPVIYLTALTDDDLLARAKKTEPYGYLLKPFNLKELQSVIETALYKHQADQTVWQAYQDWEAFFQAVGHPAIILDPQQHILKVNRAALKSIGRPAAEIEGQPCYKIFHDADAPPTGCPFDALCRSGQSETVDMELEVLGGIFLVSCTPVFNAQGKLEKVIHIATDVTARKRAEEALRANEATLQSIFRAAPIGIGVVSNRILLQVNDLICQMTGYTRAELLGQSSRLFYPSDAEFDYVGREKYRQINKQGIGTVETHWQTKDGRLLDILLSSVPLDPQNLAAGVTFTALDITARKQTEQALSRERSLLRALIDLLPDPIYAKDTATRKTLANRADLHNMGVKTEEEALGKTDFDLFPQDLAAKFYADDQSVIQTGQAVIDREEIILVDGQPRWYLTSKMPLRDSSGQVIGLVGVGHDITERKQAEDALRESENRYRRLLESVTDYIYTVQLDQGRTAATRHGQGCEGVTGYTPEEYAANPYLWYTMVHEDDRAAVIAQAAKVSAGEMPLPLEHRIIHKNGSVRWVRNTAVPRYDEKGHQVAYDGLIADVTACKQAEEEKEKLQEQLLQAQKMEAIGRLTGGIAHDFNNLLTAINGFAELAQYKLTPDNPIQEMLGYILNSGQRAANLVRQLLAFSRKQIIAPKILDLNAAITDLHKLLQRIISEQINIKMTLAPEIWPIKMDPAQLEQIVINLAVNAHDAMPQGGQLTLETANVTLSETRAQALSDLPPGDYVTLTVRDTGIGISEEIKAHLFEPFFTTKERGYGTGLGLSTCYGIAKQNNGHITVDSAPHQGATFTIYLPSALEADLPQEAPARLGNNHIPRGAETILLAEDDPAVRELAADTLRLHGYTILEAPHGLEALQIAENHRGPLHLLLTDVIMPYMGGKELADHLSAQRPRLKIIYISGYAESIITHDGVLETGINFIQKPFLPGNLARKVRQILDQ